MSDLSVWWMAIPYFLVGTGECLCNIPIYDLCYSQCPPAFRSFANAIFLYMTAVSSMLTGSFITIMSAYITDNLNDGHLEYYYFFCLACVVLFIPVNLYCFANFEEFDLVEIEAMVGPEDDGAKGETSVHLCSPVHDQSLIHALTHVHPPSPIRR